MSAALPRSRRREKARALHQMASFYDEHLKRCAPPAATEVKPGFVPIRIHAGFGESFYETIDTRRRTVNVRVRVYCHACCTAIVVRYASLLERR